MTSRTPCDNFSGAVKRSGWHDGRSCVAMREGISMYLLWPENGVTRVFTDPDEP